MAEAFGRISSEALEQLCKRALACSHEAAAIGSIVGDAARRHWQSNQCDLGCPSIGSQCPVCAMFEEDFWR